MALHAVLEVLDTGGELLADCGQELKSQPGCSKERIGTFKI